MWNGIRENSQQKKPPALMKDWAFFLQRTVMQKEKLIHGSVKLENCNLSSVAKHVWDEIQALQCFDSSNTVWVLRNDPVHVSDLVNLRPYSKLRFRGHHHGLHWHNTITALFQRAKEFLGMRWTSICLLQLSLPLFLLLTLLGYHLAGFSSALQLPDLMDMATGWRCGITSLLPTVYLLIEVFKYYNPSVGVLFRHWC